MYFINKIRTGMDPYSLLPLPRLHGKLILLKLVTPIRINLLVVLSLARWGTAVGVNRDIVAAQRTVSQEAVIATSICFCYSNYHQSLI